MSERIGDLDERADGLVFMMHVFFCPGCPRVTKMSEVRAFRVAWSFQEQGPEGSRLVEMLAFEGDVREATVFGVRAIWDEGRAGADGNAVVVDADGNAVVGNAVVVEKSQRLCGKGADLFVAAARRGFGS